MTEIIEKLSAENAQLKLQVLHLTEQLALLQKALFGRKSERIVANDAQLEFDFELQDSGAQVAEETNPSKERKSRKGETLNRFEIPENLPEEEIIIDTPEEERICKETGELMVHFSDEITRKLAYKPGSYYVKKIIRKIYKSPSTNEFITSVAPTAIIEKCRADVSLLIRILIMKFVDHLPLYRIEEILKREGIRIQRQTLSGWVLAIGEKLLPLYRIMEQKILASPRIFTDATGIDFQLKGQGIQKGYMWVYCGGDNEGSSGKSPPYLLYEFSPDGSHIYPNNKLKHFNGLLISDAHRAYEEYAGRSGVFWQVCWAHARRKFIEATSTQSDEKDKILKVITDIFMEERHAWETQDAQARLAYRNENIKPLVEKFWNLVETERMGKLLPKSKYLEALNYVIKRKKHFNTFLHRADATIDNNLAERTIKPLVIGRKNWLFLGSKDSGAPTAAILSLVQTCRHLNIEPFQYLEYLLGNLMDWNSQKLEMLLPDRWNERQQVR